MSEKTNDTIEDKIDEELKDSSSTEETETAIKEEKTEKEEETSIDASEDDLDDNVVTSKANPLPVYGKGKYFVILVIALTTLAVILGHIGSFKTGVPSAKWLRYTYIGLGAILTFLGSSLYLSAINEEEMIFNLKMGNLITTGVYSKTRNPVYVGIILLSTAALFFSGNTYMYILPIVEFFILFVWICPYEERMLEERFGDEYLKYKASTHCFLPTKKTD